jgi:hypothetical protein
MKTTSVLAICLAFALRAQDPPRAFTLRSDIDASQAMWFRLWSTSDGARTPTVNVVDRKVVAIGSIGTSAGVSSGIEGALHVVATLHGDETDRVAPYIEYSPARTPPAAGR